MLRQNGWHLAENILRILLKMTSKYWDFIVEFHYKGIQYNMAAQHLQHSYHKVSTESRLRWTDKRHLISHGQWWGIVCLLWIIAATLNDHQDILFHLLLDRLLSSLHRLVSKKTSKLCITVRLTKGGLCGNCFHFMMSSCLCRNRPHYNEYPPFYKTIIKEFWYICIKFIKVYGTILDLMMLMWFPDVWCK